MSTQWANIGEDAGALHALLQRITGRIALPLIDYIGIFPPRRVAAGDSIVIVIGVFDDDPARRRVHTACFTIARDRRGRATISERFDEHGSAPEAALHRVVQGVLRRLGEDADASPREEAIAGSTEAWQRLITELGGPFESLSPDPVADTAADSVLPDPAC
jgi:hypothetical protein